MVSLPSDLLYWNRALISATRQTKVPTQINTMIAKNILLCLTYYEFAWLRASTHATWALALSWIWQAKLGRHLFNTENILATFGRSCPSGPKESLPTWPGDCQHTWDPVSSSLHGRIHCVELHTCRRSVVRHTSRCIYIYTHILIYIYMCVCVFLKYSVHQLV